MTKSPDAAAPATGLNWNPEQRAVIAQPAWARLIVDAGPGSGKTATAAGRIVALVEGGLDPERLWAISFSRAAVSEMRERLLRLGGSLLSLPRVTTLDSLAWHLRTGDSDGQIRDGYDRAIAETLESLRAGDDEIVRRLRHIRHFVIDEAQDLVAGRAALVAAAIDALDAECGVTILTDEAQAIYGFAARALAGSFAADTLAQHLLEREDTPFRLHRLNEVHRTGDSRLLRLFATSRRHAMHPAPDPKRKLARVRRSVTWHAHARRPGDADRQTLILYRSRAEVLEAARRRTLAGQPYRLRLSGLPQALCPWVAHLLHDCQDTVLPRWKFDDLWAERVAGTGREPDSERAWQSLLRAAPHAGGRAVDMARLLARLRDSQPPPELCLFDPGDPNGPVIGTIHASKGREAARVQLMLPGPRSGVDDPDAEARVLFVGATRARERLEIGRGLSLAARRAGGDRVYLPQNARTAWIEIGRDGDFAWTAGADFTDAVAGLKPGDSLTLSLAQDGILLSVGQAVLATGSPTLGRDLHEIRARLAGGEDYRRWSARAGTLPCLDLGATASVASKPRLMLIPLAIGLVRVEFTPAEDI